jgi:hypothetical protein
MHLTDHPISKPSLDISPIWTPVVTIEGGGGEPTNPSSVE